MLLGLVLDIKNNRQRTQGTGGPLTISSVLSGGVLKWLKGCGIDEVQLKNIRWQLVLQENKKVCHGLPNRFAETLSWVWAPQAIAQAASVLWDVGAPARPPPCCKAEASTPCHSTICSLLLCSPVVLSAVGEGRLVHGSGPVVAAYSQQPEGAAERTGAEPGGCGGRRGVDRAGGRAAHEHGDAPRRLLRRHGQPGRCGRLGAPAPAPSEGSINTMDREACSLQAPAQARSDGGANAAEQAACSLKSRDIPGASSFVACHFQSQAASHAGHRWSRVSAYLAACR